MARPRKFDENESIEQALGVFWKHGFKATTPEALLKAMGIGKGSFYATFGGKRQLFLRCLRHYCDGLANLLQSTLAEEDVRKGLASVRDIVIHSACEQRTGCLLYNTASELSPHDKEIEQVVKNAMSRNESIYVKRFRKAQHDGQISGNKNATTLARYFVACFAGLQLMGKADPDAAARLRAVANLAIDSLI